MTRKLLTGAIIGLSTLFLAGAAVADDDYPNFIQGNILANQATGVHDVTSNVAPEDNNTPSGIKKINPLFCTEQLVDQNVNVAKNTCTEEDLRVNEG